MNSHGRARALWAAAAFACALSAVVPVGTLPPAFAAFVLAIAVGVVPGAWLARRLAPGESRDVRLALALLFSPFVHGGLLALTRLAGAGAEPAARCLGGAFALLAGLEALRRRSGPPEAAASPTWYVALGVGELLLLARLLLPALAVRSDGAFHAGVVWAAARALPPEDPFFAGLPLRYFWGPHAWAAGWLALAPELPATLPLVAMSASAGVAMLLAVGALACRLGATPRTGVLAQVLALAGTAPFAWLVLAPRAVAGEAPGGGDLGRAFGIGADQALLQASLVLPLERLVVVTPFAWGLAAVALAAIALASLLEAPPSATRPAAGFLAGRRRATLALACVLGTTLFAHPVAGVALAGAVLAGAVAAKAAGSAAPGAGTRVALAVLVALLALAPYVLSVGAGAGGAGGSVGLATSFRGILSVLFAGAWLLPAAALALRRGTLPAGPASALGGMLVALVVPACALHLEGENESKFLDLALLLAAAPAACVWSSAMAGPVRRTWLTALLVLAQAPTLAVMLWAYGHESNASIDAPPGPPESMMAAIRKLSPPDAVLVDATQDTTRGAAPALPGETGRALLWSGSFMASKWGHAGEALSLRERLAAELSTGAWPAEAGAPSPRDLTPGRPLWIVIRDDSALAFDRWPWKRIAHADGYALMRAGAR